MFLTHSQVADLASASGEYEPLVLSMAYTGLRWGEATGLRVHDPDLLRKRVVVTENAVQVSSVIHVGTTRGHEQRSVCHNAVIAANHPFPLDTGRGLTRPF